MPEVNLGELDDNLSFQVDAALLFELGEQLVARPSVALAELIKNAYDADARSVKITFDRVTQPGGTIIVEDTGSGMTLNEIRQGWMRIAATHKAKDPLSPKYKRVRTGAKGVGRFATRKLAHRLVLTTVSKTGPSTFEEVTIEFNWDLYHSGVDLDGIKTQYRRVLREAAKTGTTLVLSPLRHVWTEKDLEEVRNDLKYLTNPFSPATGADEDEIDGSDGPLEGQVDSDDRDVEPHIDPGFSITFVVPEFPDLQGNISERFLSAAWGKLTGTVGFDGTPRYELVIRGTTAKYSFSGSEQLPGLEGAQLNIHFLVYENTYFGDTNIGVTEARNMGRRFGGVKVYLDNFRVYPYGDPGDDWLSLDSERARRLTAVDTVLKAIFPDAERAMLNLPGNNQLFGGVFVSRMTHSSLQPTISRERLVEGPGFISLKRFVRLGVNWLTIMRDRHELEQKRAARPKLKAAEPAQKVTKPVPVDSEQPTAQYVRATVEDVSKQLESIAQPGPTDKAETARKTLEIVKQLTEMTQVVQQRETEQIDKMLMLRILASAGTSVMIFVHQVRSVLDGVGGIIRELSSPTPIDRERVVTELQAWKSVMESQATQLGLLLGKEARRRRRKLILRPVVDAAFNPFSGYAREYGVDLVNEVPPTLRTPAFFEAELHCLLLNVLTNALKAVRQEPLRRIALQAKDDGRFVSILIKDTGVGIVPEQREAVFEPFHTTSEPDPMLGVGTGLGLTIVRDIVASHQGTAKFVEVESPWRTCLELKIPHGVDDQP